MSVFLFGMDIIAPVGTAQALSPLGENAGAASALWLAAVVSHEAMFALRRNTARI